LRSPDHGYPPHPLVTALKKGMLELIREFTDPYRPELHYMRGPGPKYQEKHSRMPGPAE